MKKKTSNLRKLNDDQKTVNSLLYHMNKNRDFSSNKKENKSKKIDSLNKILNKKNSDEFNITLNTLNTKNSGPINMQSSGKTKIIVEKIKISDDKIIYLNKINNTDDLEKIKDIKKDILNQNKLPESILKILVKLQIV